MAKLGDRELDIMQVLWQRGDATVAQVHALLLEGDAEVAYTTVQTMLNRLEEKGLVAREKQGRAFRYRPRVAAPAATGAAVQRLLDRFFGGDPARLATHLIEGAIAPGDLERIQALIEQRRGRPDREGER